MTVGELKEQLELVDDALTVKVVSKVPETDVKCLIEDDNTLSIVGLMRKPVTLEDKFNRYNKEELARVRDII
jgi:hypothetical protein